MSKVVNNKQHKMPRNLKRIQGHVHTLYDSVNKNIDFGREISSTKSSTHPYVLTLVKQIRKCANDLLNNERRFTRRKYNHSMDPVLRNAAGNPAILKAAKEAALQRIQQLKKSHKAQPTSMKSDNSRTSASMSSTQTQLSGRSTNPKSNSSSSQNNVNKQNISKDSQTDLHIR